MSEPIIVTFANAADRRTCPNYRVSHTPSKHVSVMGCCRFARCVSELDLARPLHSPLDFFLGDETGRWLVEEVLFFENLNVEVPRLLLTLGLSGGRHVKLNESRYHLFCRRYYNPRSRDSVASLYAEDIRRFGYAF